MARIRTIKPEFWSHPVMTKQTDAVRLLAIALLNFSDDEGYFYAERKLIRSFVWPLDDSSKKSDRSMSELCRIGYIKMYQSKEHGNIGKVVNFNEHQRIDRPKPSEIKNLIIDERSTNDRRTIDERSTLERKGKERKGTGKGKEQGADAGSPASVFVTWINLNFQKNFSVTKKIADAVKARLKEGRTIEELQKAFYNVWNDPWHIEQNHKYTTPELITRADKLNQWLNAEPKVHGSDTINKIIEIQKVMNAPDTEEEKRRKEIFGS